MWQGHGNGRGLAQHSPSESLSPLLWKSREGISGELCILWAQPSHSSCTRSHLRVVPWSLPWVRPELPCRDAVSGPLPHQRCKCSRAKQSSTLLHAGSQSCSASGERGAGGASPQGPFSFWGPGTSCLSGFQSFLWSAPPQKPSDAPPPPLQPLSPGFLSFMTFRYFTQMTGSHGTSGCVPGKAQTGNLATDPRICVSQRPALPRCDRQCSMFPRPSQFSPRPIGEIRSNPLRLGGAIRAQAEGQCSRPGIETSPVLCLSSSCSAGALETTRRTPQAPQRMEPRFWSECVRGEEALPSTKCICTVSEQ